MFMREWSGTDPVGQVGDTGQRDDPQAGSMPQDRFGNAGHAYRVGACPLERLNFGAGVSYEVPRRDGEAPSAGVWAWY